MLNFKCCKDFLVRLLNFVTIYKRNKTTAKMGNYAQKSENFV